MLIFGSYCGIIIIHSVCQPFFGKLMKKVLNRGDTHVKKYSQSQIGHNI